MRSSLRVLETGRFRPTVRPLVLASCFLALVLLLVWLGFSLKSWNSLSVVAVVGGLTIILLSTLLDKQGSLSRFDLRSPWSLYGFFYLLYYGSSLVLLAVTGQSDNRNLPEITGLIVFGYGAFWLGTKLARLKLGNRPPAWGLSPEQGRALLGMCYLGALLVYFYYGWRIDIGQFYTHAAYYEQATTLSATLIQNVAGFFCVPLLVFASILTSAGDLDIANRARRFLFFYAGSIFAIAIVASEFRLALTAVLFLLVARSSQNRQLQFRHLVICFIAGALAITAVEGTRQVLQYSGVADSQNQLVYSFDHTLDGIGAVFQGQSPAVQATVERAADTLLFLSDIIDAIHSGRPHLHGTVLLDSLYSLIPRAVWPQKPILISTQLQMEQQLHLPLSDASPGPVTQFYADWGVAGVLVGFLCFGLFLGLLTKHAMRTGSVISWLALAWIWSVAVQVETDLTLGVLGALRHLLLAIIIYQVILFWIRTSRPKAQIIFPLTRSRFPEPPRAVTQL